MTFDFSPLEDDNKTVRIQDKKTFILTMKNVGDILDLDTRSPYNPAID